MPRIGKTRRHLEAKDVIRQALHAQGLSQSNSDISELRIHAPFNQKSNLDLLSQHFLAEVHEKKGTPESLMI